MLNGVQAHCGDAGVDAKVNEKVAHFCAVAAKQPGKSNQVCSRPHQFMYCTPHLSNCFLWRHHLRAGPATKDCAPIKTWRSF